MKKIFTLLLAFGLSGVAFGQITAVYEFTGTSNADGQFNNITTQPVGATFSPITRSNVIWNSGVNYFNSADWSTASGIDLTEYVSFSVTTDADKKFTSTNTFTLSSLLRKSTNGPNNCEVRYKYGSQSSFQAFSGNLITPTTTDVTYNFIIPASGMEENLLEIRFYGITAISNIGTFRFDNVRLTSSVPLPVSFLSFNATALNNAVALQWKTASEQDNSHFTLSRSATGTEYSPIATLAATNANTVKTYTYTDNTKVEGTVYYQLSQTDIDGTTKILGTQAVTANNSKMTITVGSQTAEAATLNIYSPVSQPATIQLYDLSGRNLSTQTANLQAGNNTVTIANIQNQGINLVRVIGLNEVSVKKLNF